MIKLKIFNLFILTFLSINFVFAQTVKKKELKNFSDEYIQVTFNQILLKKAPIKIISEEQTGFLRDIDNKKIYFQNIPAILNYLEFYGYKFVGVYLDETNRKKYIIILKKTTKYYKINPKQILI